MSDNVLGFFYKNKQVHKKLTIEMMTTMYWTFV